MKKIKLSSACAALSLVLGMPVLLVGCDMMNGPFDGHHQTSANYGGYSTKSGAHHSKHHEDRASTPVKHTKASSSSAAATAHQPAAQPKTTSTVPLDAPAVGQ